MRSQRSASFMKWVDRKMVTPSSRERSISVRQKASRATGATTALGSARVNLGGRRSGAADGVDARSGLFKNQGGRPVEHGDRKLQSLLHAKRQALRLGVSYSFQV